MDRRTGIVVGIIALAVVGVATAATVGFEYLYNSVFN